MRSFRFLALALSAALLLPVPADAQGANGYYREATQALTRAAPTLATEGLSLAGTKRYTVSVCAAAGQTITAGTSRAWWFNPVRKLWQPSAALDVPLDVGKRCTTRTFSGVHPVGNILYANDSVTLSAGTSTDTELFGSGQ